MRIYLEHFNYQNINFNNLNKCNKEERNQIEIYSDEGIYLIENDRLYKLKLMDGNIERSENYINNINLLIDKTIIKKQQNIVSHVSMNNIKRELKLYYYKLREKSPLRLVLTYENGLLVDMYFMLFETYAAYSAADMDNFSIKEDMNSFLNLL